MGVIRMNHHHSNPSINTRIFLSLFWPCSCFMSIHIIITAWPVATTTCRGQQNKNHLWLVATHGKGKGKIAFVEKWIADRPQRMRISTNKRGRCYERMAESIRAIVHNMACPKPDSILPACGGYRTWTCSRTMYFTCGRFCASPPQVPVWWIGPNINGGHGYLYLWRHRRRGGRWWTVGRLDADDERGHKARRSCSVVNDVNHSEQRFCLTRDRSEWVKVNMEESNDYITLFYGQWRQVKVQ